MLFQHGIRTVTLSLLHLISVCLTLLYLPLSLFLPYIVISLFVLHNRWHNSLFLLKYIILHYLSVWLNLHHLTFSLAACLTFWGRLWYCMLVAVEFTTIHLKKKWNKGYQVFNDVTWTKWYLKSRIFKFNWISPRSLITGDFLW